MFFFHCLVGHVGAPGVCNYFKLVDVPEMEYYASKNQGEVCLTILSDIFSIFGMFIFTFFTCNLIRGSSYSYICVLHYQFLLKLIVFMNTRSGLGLRFR